MLRYLLFAFTLLFLSACQNDSQDVGVKTCDTEPVIMVVAGQTLDRTRMRQYAKAIADSGIYTEVGGYYLNSPAPAAVFEGDIPKGYVTLMVRFPSLKKAEEFWNSEVYQNEIKPLRLNPSAGDYFVTVYKETDMPSYMKGKISNGNYLCE